MPSPGRPRVYLAGPTVFLADPTPIFDSMKHICQQHGLTGVSPWDNQMGLAGLPPDRALLERIVRADIELLDQLDGGLFCLDGFRGGPEMDAGTAFELGYMRALNKPIAGWTADPRPYPAKVADYIGQTRGLSLTPAATGTTGGTSGAFRDPDGILVHSEGCLQNAMIDFGISTAGGASFADPNWKIAFGGAAEFLAKAFAASRFRSQQAALVA